MVLFANTSSTCFFSYIVIFTHCVVFHTRRIYADLAKLTGTCWNGRLQGFLHSGFHSLLAWSFIRRVSRRIWQT
jgi:hypothetical protein